jgi:cell division protein FtsQ
MGNRKEILKKVGIITLWVCVGSCSLVLLIAANIQQAGEICKDVVVTIKSTEHGNYIHEKEILNRVSNNDPSTLKGKDLRRFNLSELEAALEQHLWIRNAELFFDVQNILHIDVEERIPVGRIFCVDGESFYVDELGIQLPANGNQIADVPVFTGFPPLTKPLLSKDSILLMQVRDVGGYILKNDFWNAQIEQIHIENYSMELIPKLGKHQIIFGEGKQVEQKFKRLLLFYKNVLNKAGWNYYSVLDLRYDKQLVGVRRDSVSLYESFKIPFDSIEINQVLDTTRIELDTLMQSLPAKSEVTIQKETVISKEEMNILKEVNRSQDNNRKKTN